MLALTTPVPWPQMPRLSYSESSLWLGSCFAENMGQRFALRGFSATINPLGIIFNPLALGNVLLRALEERTFVHKDFLPASGGFATPYAHSSLAQPSADEACNLANEQLARLRDALEQASTVWVTLGTASAWTHNELGLVANCQKLPANQFTKSLTQSEEIVACWQSIRQLAGSGKQWVFTVSPVRHTRDGMTWNTRSKARLLEAAMALSDDTHSFYLPVYETFMDELRDYRWYASDLIHPSDLALDLIDDRLCQYAMAENTRATVALCDKLNRHLSHRTTHPSAEWHNRVRAWLTELEDLAPGRWEQQWQKLRQSNTGSKPVPDRDTEKDSPC